MTRARLARLLLLAVLAGLAPALPASAPAQIASPEHDFPQRVLYRLTPPAELLARIEGDRDGEVRGLDFPLRRVECPG